MAVAVEPSTEPSLPTSDARRPDGPAPSPVSRLTWLLGAWVALLLLAFSPAVHAVYWAPKVALALPLVVPGLVALVHRLRERMPGARAAAAFLAVALLATATSDLPLLSFLGSYNWGIGWLFYALVVGLWAIGAGSSPAVRRAVERGLLVGAAANAGFAFAQALFDLRVDVLDPPFTRAAGFTGNPVHLGALAVGGLWLAVAGLARVDAPTPLAPGAWRPALRWLALAALFGGAVQLSGSRSGLVPVVVLALVALGRLGARRGAAFAAAVVIGIAAGSYAPGLGGEGTGTGAVDRAAVSMDPGASNGRTAAWRASPSAIAEQPLLGWGPGRFRAAVSPRVGPEVSRFEGGEAEYVDAHNLGLEVAVTTGLLGALAAGAWIVTAGRRSRGPLLGFAVAAGSVLLAQPLSLSVVPAIALAFGAGVAEGAGRGRTVAGSAGGWWRSSTGIGVAGAVAGVAVAVVFLAGQAAMVRATTDFDAARADRADRLQPPWPTTASVQSRIAAFEGISQRDDARWEDAARWARVAAERDPSVSTSWNALADLELRLGRTDAAREAYRNAYQAHPWSGRAIQGLVFFADRDGDVSSVAELCERWRQVREGDCLETVRRTYADFL